MLKYTILFSIVFCMVQSQRPWHAGTGGRLPQVLPQYIDERIAAEQAQTGQTAQAAQPGQTTQSAQGAQGNSVDQRIQGIPVDQGIQGTSIGCGTQGIPVGQGVQGISTSQGAQGIPTYQGSQGIPIYQGTQRIPTYQETQGIPTYQGSQGIPIYQGTQRIPTYQETQGIPTYQGAQGIPTYQGTQGNQINTGSTLLGNRIDSGDSSFAAAPSLSTTINPADLPVDAHGDIDLVNRIKTWPRDKQPFWYINWQAIQAHRGDMANNTNPTVQPTQTQPNTRSFFAG